MTSRVAAFLLLLVAAASAGPLQAPNSALCRRSCQLTEDSKYQYDGGRTYRYDFETESSVHVNKIQGKQVQLKWSAEVDLHFQSPCEVTLEIKNPLIHGSLNREFAEKLTKFPLRAVMIDGSFEDVCTDRQDDAAAVNIKKGILSSLQNSLPSNSSLNDGIEVEETDVLGVCPTVYRVRKDSERVLVEKSKDHRLCSNRPGGLSESQFAGLLVKDPIIMRQSNSKCQQEFEDGLLKSAKCQDINELSGMPGVHKTLFAHQTSELKFKTVLPLHSAKSLQEIKKSNLIYDMAYSPKDPSKNKVLESQLKGFCTQLEHHNITTQSARQYSEIVRTMNKVEESFILQALQKIRSGSLCRDSKKLESFYLDAISETINAGAINVMVQEILNDNRLIRYTWRLHTIPRVCIHGVEAIIPLFQNDTLPITVTMAAGTVVKKYCEQEGCTTEKPILEIMSIIKNKLQTSCALSQQNPSHKMIALAQLKALGNIKNATMEVREAVVECFQQPRADMNVRLAAAEALRVLSCRDETTTPLLHMAAKENLPTELRIAAYASSVLCANTEQLESLLHMATSGTSDVNVQSYILSDLTSLQKSKAPYKLDVRHRLARFNISQEYLSLPSNTSRNLEWSVFSQSGAFGSELSRDFIYALGSAFPKQFRTNLTIDLFKQIMHVAEGGIRIENLPALIRSALGPNSLIGKSKLGEFTKVLVDALPKSGNETELTVFFKSFGQELLYHSFSNLDKIEKDIVTEMSVDIFTFYTNIMSGMHFKRSYGFEFRYDLYVCTIQGIPLRLSEKITALASLNGVSEGSTSDHFVELSPQFAVLAVQYAGYKFGPSVGITSNTTIYSSSDAAIAIRTDLRNKFSMNIIFPREEAEVFTFRTHSYLSVQEPGKSEKIVEDSQNDPRWQNRKCPYTLGGMKMCYEYDIYDFYTGKDFPLVRTSYAKLWLKKEVPSMEGFVLNITQKRTPFLKYEVKFSAPGTPMPTKLDTSVGYISQNNKKTLELHSLLMGNKTSIKIVYDFQQSPERQRKLELFSGSEHLKRIFVAKLVNSDLGETKLKLKTTGAAKNLLIADVDVDVVIDPKRESLKERLESFVLKRFEVTVGTENFKTVNHIRRTHKTNVQSEFVGLSQMIYRKQIVWGLSTTSVFQNEHEGIKMAMNITGNNYDESRSAHLDVVLSSAKQLISLEAFNKTQQICFKLLGSSIVKPATTRKSFILMDIPQQKIAWRVSSEIKQVSDKHHLDLVITSNAKEKLSIRGPVSGTWGAGILKEKAEIGLRLFGEDPTYYLETEIDMRRARNYLRLTLNNEKSLLANYSHDARLITPYLSFSNKIDIPSLLLTDIELKKTPIVFESNVEVKLLRYFPQHVQAQLSLHGIDDLKGHLSSKIYWDKTNNPEKNIEFTGTFSNDENSQLTVRGDATYLREKYYFLLSKLLKHSDSWTKIEKDFSIEIMKGSEDIFQFRSMCSLDFAKRKDVKLDSELYLLTPYKNEYSLKKSLEIVEMSSNELDVKYESLLQTPKSGQTQLSVTVSKKTTRDSVYKIQTHVKNTKPQEREPRFRVDCKGQIENSLEGKFKTINIDMNMIAGETNIELVASEDCLAQETKISLKKNSNQLIGGYIKRQGLTQINAEFNVSNRSMALTGQYDQQEKFLRLHANRLIPNEKIEIRLTNHSVADNRDIELSLQYPHNHRQKSVIGIINMNKNVIMGEIKLDVSSTNSKVLTLIVNGTRVEPNIFRLETTIDSNQSTRGPKLMVDIATTHQLKYLVASYQKDSQTTPTVLLSSKYVRQSQKSGVVSLSLQTTEKQFEFGGTFTSENDYGCKGYKLNTTVQSMFGNKYAFKVVTCSPMFMKIITGVKGGSDKYVTKVGLRSFSHLEMSLMKNSVVEATNWWKKWTSSDTERSENPAIALSANLVTPYTLGLRAQYSNTTLAPTMSLVKEKLQSVASAVKTVLQNAGTTLKTDIQTSFPELSYIIDRISETLHEIMEYKIVKDITHLYTRTSNSSIIKHIADIIRTNLNKLRAKLDVIMSKLSDTSDKMLTKIHSWMAQLLKHLEKYVGPMDGMHDKAAAALDNFTLNVMDTSLGHLIQDWLNSLCETYASDCEELKVWFEEIGIRVRDDLKKGQDLLLKDKSVQYVRSVVRRYGDMIERKQYSQLIQLAALAATKYNFGFFIDLTGIQLYFPLTQPMTNVLRAPMFVGIPKKSFNIHLTGLTLRTTTNSVITIPRSTCEYTLSRYINKDGPEVTFKRAGYDNFTIKMKYKDHEVEVKPNVKTTYIDGVRQKEDYSLTLIYAEFVASLAKQTFITQTRRIYWESALDIKKHTFMSYWKTKMTGIGWLTYKNNISYNELMAIFASYKLDDNCRD